jgi:hypothetical protein
MNTQNPQEQQKTEAVNGHANGHVNGQATNGQATKSSSGRVFVQREIHLDRCAMYFEHGYVVTFIFADLKPWNECCFRVEQVRKGLNGKFSDSFRSEDTQDMIRGAYEAKRWIKKRQRAHTWKVLVALP